MNESAETIRNKFRIPRTAYVKESYIEQLYMECLKKITNAIMKVRKGQEEQADWGEMGLLK